MVERGEWSTLTPVWVDQIAPKEEGRQKSVRHGIVARPSGEGGGRDTVFDNGVDPHLRIMEIMGDMTAAASLDNLSFPLSEDGRDICLRFQ